VTRASGCPSGGERDTALLYLAGRLSERDATAFEEHYFSCAQCREDVTRGGELREAMGRPPVAMTTARSRRTWLPLAAAAAIAILGIGTWRLTRRGSEETSSTLRAGHEILKVTVTAGPQGGFEAAWRAPSHAATYAVEVFGADGATLWKGEAREAHVTIGPEILSKPGTGTAPLVQVEAFDAMHQSVARSAPTPLVEGGHR